MTTYPMKLVTVVCEALAREPLQEVLAEVGAHGHTVFHVEGAGAQGERAGELREFSNIQLEVIVQPTVAQSLLARLERDFFPRFAMVAYETDVRVLRREKF